MGFVDTNLEGRITNRIGYATFAIINGYRISVSEGILRDDPRDTFPPKSSRRFYISRGQVEISDTGVMLEVRYDVNQHGVEFDKSSFLPLTEYVGKGKMSDGKEVRWRIEEAIRNYIKDDYTNV